MLNLHQVGGRFPLPPLPSGTNVLAQGRTGSRPQQHRSTREEHVPPPAPSDTPSSQQHAPLPPNAPQGRKNREGPEETGHGERDEQGEITGQGRLRSPKMVQSTEGGGGRTKGKESLCLLEAPVRKIILQMHTPARTSQCWRRQTQHGLRVCIWMPLVNGTGNSPSLGQPTLE